jgi:hypothetical protein
LSSPKRSGRIGRYGHDVWDCEIAAGGRDVDGVIREADVCREAVAGVQRLDDDERAHLDRLLAALTPATRKRRRRVAAKDPVSPGVRVLLDALDHFPAAVFNGRLDALAFNAWGGALYAPV